MTEVKRATRFIAGRSVWWITNNILELKLDRVNGIYFVSRIDHEWDLSNNQDNDFYHENENRNKR